MCNVSTTLERFMIKMLTRPLILVCGLCLIGCSQSGSHGKPSSTDKSEHAIATEPTSAVSILAPDDSLTRLIDRLSITSGVWLQGAEWSSLDIPRLLDAFEPFGDSAVVRLVDCMDDDRPAAATVERDTIARGAMCYAALTHIAYYEAFAHRPDDEHMMDPWRGDMSLGASPSVRRKAQAAWRAVVRLKAYHLS